MGFSFLYLSVRRQDFCFMIHFRYVISIAEVIWLWTILIKSVVDNTHYNPVHGSLNLEPQHIYRANI